jgi:hypothetical protein
MLRRFSCGLPPASSGGRSSRRRTDLRRRGSRIGSGWSFASSSFHLRTSGEKGQRLSSMARLISFARSAMSSSDRSGCITPIWGRDCLSRRLRRRRPSVVRKVKMIASPLVICGKAEYSASPNARQPCPRPRRHGDHDPHRPPCALDPRSFEHVRSNRQSESRFSLARRHLGRNRGARPIDADRAWRASRRSNAL